MFPARTVPLAVLVSQVLVALTAVKWVAAVLDPEVVWVELHLEEVDTGVRADWRLRRPGNLMARVDWLILSAEAVEVDLRSIRQVVVEVVP
jgi:hypothetical protein